ncbi:hypothetical protein ACFL59_00175 [Planctomycetota bacterium]
MRAAVYYCATCGMKLSVQEARLGRTRLDDRTCHCPSCVVEHGIRVVEPPPADQDPMMHGSGSRSDSMDKAADMSRSKRRSARRKPPKPVFEEPVVEPGSSTLPLVVGGSALLVGLVLTAVAFLSSGPASSSTRRSLSRPGAVAPQSDQSSTETASRNARRVETGSPSSGTGSSRAGDDRSGSSAGGGTADGRRPADGGRDASGAVEQGEGGASVDTASAPSSGEAAADTSEAKYVINTARSVVHRTDCGYAKRLGKLKRRPVSSLAEALELDCKPCRSCLSEKGEPSSKGVRKEYEKGEGMW